MKSLHVDQYDLLQTIAKMTQESDLTALLSLTERIHAQVSSLEICLKQNSLSHPSLAVGGSTELWSSQITEIQSARNNVYGLTKQVTKLLGGPHEYLHEFISSNWEQGALYTLLEFQILEKIPLDGSAHVSLLASKSGLVERKLLSVLRLVSCEGILNEVSEGWFGHTAISEELVTDENFKAFIGFQFVSSFLLIGNGI